MAALPTSPLSKSPSAAELKRRARELGVDVPSHVEKTELVALLEAAELRRTRPQQAHRATLAGWHHHQQHHSPGGGHHATLCGGQSIGELRARLAELGVEAPSHVSDRYELFRLVEEAERRAARHAQGHTQGGLSATLEPKVRFRTAAGSIPPPWYQKESRSHPGCFYFVNADTGETAWELPQAALRAPAPPEGPPPWHGGGATSVPAAAAEEAAQPGPVPVAELAPETPAAGPPGVEAGAGAEGGGAEEAEAQEASSLMLDELLAAHLEDSSRHDYRDDGFHDDHEVAVGERSLTAEAPASAGAGAGAAALGPDKRWSRAGAMSCQRSEVTGWVVSLSLAPDSDTWDPETTLMTASFVRGSTLTWARGKMIGRGSLGRVFKALDVLAGRTLAVKEVPIDLNNDADKRFMDDLENEVSIMRELKHPHIVSYLGHDFMDNSLYMYIEHMPGGSLTQALQQFGRFDESLLAQYAQQILMGLEHLHTRTPPVVHRDIKGPNILVGADCRVKLADFGCAKRTQETMTHTMRGSIHWMAPEVIAHERYGRAADIWSFGCVAIEMGTASVPWGKFDNQMAAVIKIGMSDDTPPLPRHLSPTGEDFIAQCVRRDAALRPSATELLNHALLLGIDPEPPPG